MSGDIFEATQKEAWVMAIILSVMAAVIVWLVLRTTERITRIQAEQDYCYARADTQEDWRKCLDDYRYQKRKGARK